jgi:lipopolysaccharide heptosyltransferase II
MENKILIIKLGAIGDMIHTIPLISNLKENLNAKIYFLSSLWTKEILECFEDVDKIFLFPGRGERNFYLFLKTWFELRKEKFDYIFVLNRSKLAQIFAKSLRKKQIISFLNVKFDANKHESERYLDLARAIGIEIKKIDKLKLKMKKEIEEKVEIEIKKIMPKKLIAIHVGGGINPGTYMPIKRWGIENYISLIKKLINLDMWIVLVGGKEDKILINRVKSEINKNIIDVSGIGIKELIVWLKKCDLFIGGDSGPLHIAGACGISTIGIFGPSNPNLVAPLGEKNKVIWKRVSCSPCYDPISVKKRKDFSYCITGTHECMKKIIVEDVLEVAIQMLNYK